MTITDPLHQQPDVAAGEAELFYYRHDELLPADDNLRGAFTDVSELADSIAESGLLQPLKISFEAGRPRIVAGNRRHAAIGTLIADGRWPAGRRISCFFAGDLDDDARTVAMLVENLQRVDLDPVEEARGYQRLKEAGWKPAKIAARTGRPVDRVSGRLKLLNLPAKALGWISDGTMPLERAAKLVAAPTPVVEAIAKKLDPPTSDWVIEQAVKDHKTVVARETTRATCADRGLEFRSGDGYTMHRSHVEVQKCSPAGLAKVLLPEDVTGWAVTLETWSSSPKCTIWKPITAATDTAEDRELNEFEQWEVACQAIDEAHDAELRAWRDGRRPIQVEVAKAADAKVVAQAALRFTVQRGPSYDQDIAKALGWEHPSGRVDAATVNAAVEQFLYGNAKNLVAAAALQLLISGSEASDELRAKVDALHGEQPTRPEYPPKPDGYDAWNEGTDLDDDQDDGEDEEGDDDE